MTARRLLPPLAALTLGLGVLSPLTTAVPAFVGESNATIEVTTTADVVNAEDDVTSLREAFDQANANVGADTIALTTDPGAGRYEFAECGEWDTYEYENAYGDLNHTDQTGALTIEGHGNAIAATCGERAISSIGAGLLTLRDLTVEDSGYEPPGGGFGGGVYAHGDILGEHLLLRRNRVVQGNGTGAIHSDSDIELRDSVVAHNSETGISGRSVHLVDTIVRSNSGVDGGGVYAVRDVVAEGSTFRANAATGNRGSHVCCGDGGAILVPGGEVHLEHSVVVANHANGHGAGVSARNAVIRDSTLRANVADHGGGAIYTDDLARVVRSTIAQNRGGSGRGGGIFAGSAQIVASTLNGNQGTEGGAIGAVDGVALTDSTISANHAYGQTGSEGRGGGIYTIDGSISLLRSTIVDNQAGKGANIRHGASLVARASIVGRAVGGVGCWGPGPTVSHGFNVTDPSARCGFNSGGDRIIMVGIAVGPLADNGGPTSTRLPLDENLSNISLAACSDHPDQRGQPRPQGDRCEAGSVEIP